MGWQLLPDADHHRTTVSCKRPVSIGQFFDILTSRFIARWLSASHNVSRNPIQIRGGQNTHSLFFSFFFLLAAACCVLLLSDFLELLFNIVTKMCEQWMSPSRQTPRLYCSYAKVWYRVRYRIDCCILYCICVLYRSYRTI